MGNVPPEMATEAFGRFLSDTPTQTPLSDAGIAAVIATFTGTTGWRAAAITVVA